MEKPIYDEKYVEEAYEKLEADSPELHELIGWVEACKAWQKYHDWYLKEKCIKKEDLPDEERLLEFIPLLYCEVPEYVSLVRIEAIDRKGKRYLLRIDNGVELAKAIAKRIRERQNEKA